MPRSVGTAVRGAAFALLLLPAWNADAGAAEPQNIKGLFLTASYPALTVTAGQTTTIPIQLRNYGLPPEPVALSLSGLPKGWMARFIGGEHVISAVMATPGDSVDFKLRLDVPKETKEVASVQSDADGRARIIRASSVNLPKRDIVLVVHAKGETQSASLPLGIRFGDTLPVALSLKPDLPSLSGTPTADFKYTLALHNDSARDLLVSLAAADLPKGFQASFTKEYGSQEIASLPLKAGQSENVSMKVSPPPNISAGAYRFKARAAAADASATAALEMIVTGQPKLSLATPDERLSGDAEAGKPTPISLIVSNTGSAPARDIELSATAPSKWTVSFEPKKIALIEPDGRQTVTATLTPSAKAIAGDYMTTLRARAAGTETSADYRVTVTTSTLWGIVGVGIIAIALLAAMGAVVRFGRR